MRWFLAAAALSAVVFSGCTFGKVRERTRPAEVHYTRSTDLHESMQTVITHAHALDDLLLRSGARDDDERARAVIEHLRAMRSAVATIDPGSVGSHHRLLDENLYTFIRDLQLAEREARANPPRYFRAASITGACVPCHRVLDAESIVER